MESHSKVIAEYDFMGICDWNRNAIIETMENNTSSGLNLTTGIDLAFALVVFISFFSAFSSSPVTSLFLIMLIVILGVAYIANGIYGFSYIRKVNSSFIKGFYFFSQFLIGGLIIYFGRGAGFSPLILLPVVAHTVIVLDDNWSLLANLGILLTFTISLWAFSHDFFQIWKAFPVFFAGQVFILIFTQMTVTEQKARKNLENLAEELSIANKQLSEYAEQVHELAVAQERNRFAREIHDGLGHYLTTINMQINAAEALLYSDTQKAGEMLEKAKKLTSEALVEVRDSVYALRKDMTELSDLTSRVNELAEGARVPGRAINVNLMGDSYELTPQTYITIYRAAQETINNAQKYSQADLIELTLDYRNPDQFVFCASDNGIGVEELKTGYGLIGIQERVRLLNGEVLIENRPGAGFSVIIKLPVTKQ
ncbi:MAG: sensor histidine kinase [Anaerolineaceae bacterium]